MMNNLTWLQPFCRATPITEPIVDLCIDSRQVKPGMCFIALPGTYQDGRLHIKEALARGATLVLAEEDENWPGFDDRRIIGIAKLRQKLGQLAASFYGSQVAPQHTVAVTGTNGKSTCVHWLAQMYQAMSEPAWLWSTIGFGTLGHLQPSSQTTPDPLTLHRLLAQAAKPGRQLILEASSHALAQYRLDGIPIHTAVLTNCTHDHLDYHGSMVAYAAAKSRLFTAFDPKIVVLNYDDPLGQQLSHTLNSAASVYTYGCQEGARVRAQTIQLLADGIEMAIESPWGDCEVRLPCYGRFNAYNWLAVFTVLAARAIPLARIVKAAEQLTGVPGRMQRLAHTALPNLFIDYAHTPDALQQALQSIRSHGFKSIGCVFGCGGQRDRSKRAKMGHIAKTYADWVILTNDNPRDEDPVHIVEDILQGISNRKHVSIELDREQALAKAIARANPGEAILVAGKGHETVQWLSTGPKPFADYSTIMALLAIKHNLHSL